MIRNKLQIERMFEEMGLGKAEERAVFTKFLEWGQETESDTECYNAQIFIYTPTTKPVTEEKEYAELARHSE